MSLSRILANIGTALDSATTGDFLSKVDSDGVFGGVAYSSVTGTPTVLDSANVTNLIDSAYVQLRQSAVSGGGLDSATTILLIDSDYITSRATASGFQMFEYDATAGQTDFTGSDVNGNTLAYSQYGLLVHYNGILLSAATDYTATDGTTVVLTDSADAGARITIAKWSLASAGGGASAAVHFGDRGLVSGGYGYTTDNGINDIQYFDITSPGNATDFGDLVQYRLYAASTADGTYSLTAAGWDLSSLPSRGTLYKSIDYVTVATTGNAANFGDVVNADRNQAVGVASDGSTGLFFSGNTYKNNIDYITITTTGNATNFGTLTANRDGPAAASDNTYGLCASGNTSGSSNISIDYVTIQTTSNASDFGDVTAGRYAVAGASNNTYSLFGGGYVGATKVNTIDYVTTATPSNATDFGDLVATGGYRAGTNNSTIAIFAGRDANTTGSEIDYVTIATPSNATDFGDLTQGVYGAAASSGSPS